MAKVPFPAKGLPGTLGCGHSELRSVPERA
jgi:hypothetical protein